MTGDATRALAQSGSQASIPILERNIEVSREDATSAPRSEGDQAMSGGWPLYRTPAGQRAYNAAMATLRATDGRAPAASLFAGCAELKCNLKLPRIDGDGWIPAGRLWVSPREYVLVAHSPRGGRRSASRHSARGMRYFVFHEFHNSSRNTDPYDTISSHSGSVFVPFYMSKEAVDARGARFVVVVQVAPYDVDSVHATNYGSAGPGIEVANNVGDDLEGLQIRAGVVVATIVKAAAPRLKVVNHRGREGLAMLEAYDERLEAIGSRSNVATIALPFTPAPPERIAAATGHLAELVAGQGASPRIPLAERRFFPRREAIEPVAAASAGGVPTLVSPVQLARRPAPLGGPLLVEPPRLVTRSRASESVTTGR